MARRLRAGLEVLPFRYGMTLAVGAVVALVLVVAGFMTLGGDPRKRATPGLRTTVNHRPVEAAASPAPPAPTWGAYVPPRKTRPVAVHALTRTVPVPVPVPPRPRPPRTAPRPVTAFTCPPRLKKWIWVWEVCKRRQHG